MLARRRRRPLWRLSLTEADMKVACGVCHSVPPPDILPRSAWRAEIARMMLIREGRPEPVGPVGTSTRMVLLSDDLLRVWRYYDQHAPNQLPPATPWPAADASGFAVHDYSPVNAPPLPAISHVRALDLAGDGKIEVVGSDMRQGFLVAGRAGDTAGRLRILGQAVNPSNFQIGDLDGDHRPDLFVADLGSFQPEDHTRGAVMWLRRTVTGYSPFRLEGWPRVADVEPADMNGDGKPDLVVAAFGWRKVGSLSVLENRTSDYARPSFVTHVIDPRPGNIHAIPVDMNGDGKLDIVALFSQQFEQVVVYTNTGSSRSRRRPSTRTASQLGIHGDPGRGPRRRRRSRRAHDARRYVRQSNPEAVHGIQWLENKGDGTFVEHPIAEMPGVMRALAGDLDGDGDLDIVACSLVAQPVDARDQPGTPSLVWLEQTSKGVFVKHTLESKPPRHATLDLADVNGDGALDIVVGNFFVGNEGLPWIEVWENRRKKN